jgi:hypothetical protein
MNLFENIFPIIMLAIPCIGFSQSENVIQLNTGWKFIPGDSLQYALPAYDDSKWTTIRVDKIWEDQGYEKLDGFAWYRIKFTLPGSMRDSAYLKDGLRIFLGKINNYDQSFLNGQLFGRNAKVVPTDTPIDTSHFKDPITMWDVARCYILPVDDKRILWGKENVLAVRVYDAGGQGGMYTGDQNIRMVKLGDYLEFDNGNQPFMFGKKDVSKSFSAKNTSNVHTLEGNMKITATNQLTMKSIYQKTYPVVLKPQSTQQFTVLLKQQDQSVAIEYEFEFANVRERAVFTEVVPYILTPKPSAVPKINGALVYGQRPKKPFQFTIAATGSRPMTFSAKSLPTGLTLDPKTGIITGRVEKSGEYDVQLSAKNANGKDTRNLKIVIGQRLALTPPLGWNSWNCWGLSVDEGKVRASANIFKAKGLMDHGWTYINIDDGWEIVGTSTMPNRDSAGNILTNEKFKNMKALGDSIHALGLKFGIYSSPGPLTCGGYTASYQFEANDARSYADWGIDYLKYDWCSYGNIAKDTTREEYKKPYTVMRKALDNVDRDIVYSLCQYGMGNVWEWGDEVGGNLWRTTGDITDTWQSLSEIGFSQIANAPYAGPGNWNDPDMLVVGWVGWGPSLHPTKLTPDEQYTHISLWCLLSAPLLIGCDLERLDEFTLNLLTNDEVLAIDQDPLGKQAVPVIKSGNIQVWAKSLHDGSNAIGIFNLGATTETYTLSLDSLGLKSPTFLRDVWRQKDLGKFIGKFEAIVPSHGVVLVKTKI